MAKPKLKIVMGLCLHLLLQVIFSHIKLFGFLSPVGLSFAFSKVYFGSNIFAVTLFYAISKIFLFCELKWVLVTAYEIVFLALYYFAKEFIKTDNKFLLCNLFLVFSNVLKLYFEIQTIESVLMFLIDFICQVLVLLYLYKFNQVYKNKLVFYKFSRSDYFVFSLFVIMLSLGVFSFEFLYAKLGLAIIVLFVLFGVKILPIDRFFISLIMVAIGTVVVSADYFLFQFAVILSVVLVLFKDFNRWIFILILILTLSFLLIIFNIFDIFVIISIIFAIFLFIFIPPKFVSRLAEIIEADASGFIFQKYQEEKVNEIKHKLLMMADTLVSMKNNFKFLLIGKIDREKASKELSTDVIAKCCNECENYKYCFLQNINKKEMFDSLLFKAIENKQISVLEVGNGVQTYCHKTGIVVSEINQMAKVYLSFENKMKTQDESKLMISSELENFSAIFKNFAKNIKNTLKINEKLSKILKENFINAIIDIKEAVIFENESGVEMINLIVSNDVVLKRELPLTISQVIKNQVVIKKLVHLNTSGLSLVTFVPKPKINIQFAVSSKAKEKQNGDSAVITKLSDNKFFVAIADGMGHGEQANKLSSMVLNMIRSMFEVGLDAELILQSVNKLLIPAGLDNFSTLDACVVDVEKGECCFIKLGASVSVLKHRDTSELVASESLPIGIVQNVKPTIVKKQIYQGDMIFLASDGVVDSFSNVQSYLTFINDSKIYNLQKFVDDVVLDAQNMNNAYIDDMTIIGINLLKN